MRCSATTVLPVPGPPSTTRAPREPARMMASWSAWMVPSTSRIRLRPAAAQAGDEGGLVVERGGVPGEPVGGEHLVPVVADPAAGPAVPAPAGQTHRVGVGRAEERLRRRGSPVDQQPPTRAVGEAEPADVHGLVGRRRRRCGRGTGRGCSGAGCAGERSVGGSPGRGPSPAGRCRRAPCARRRGGRTGRRPPPRGSPRSPRTAARRRRSAPDRPWRRGCREGRKRWRSRRSSHQLRCWRRHAVDRFHEQVRGHRRAVGADRAGHGGGARTG